MTRRRRLLSDKPWNKTRHDSASGESGFFLAAPAATKPTPFENLRTCLALALCVAIATAAAHWPALSTEAMSFDDDAYVLTNRLVGEPSLGSAWRFMSEVLEPSTVKGYYQPLTMISLMIDSALWGRGDHLKPFHRTSLALHVLNTTFVVIFLYVLFGQPWTAALVGLLFGVHPLSVEPVPWVSERKTLLSAFFALPCLIMYVRYARRPRLGSYIGVTILYVLSLLAKPISTPLVVAMLLFDYWPFRRFSLRAIIEKAPLFLIAAVSSYITFESQTRTASTSLPTDHSPIRIILILCHNIVFYLYKMLWPTNLTSHYPPPNPLAITHPMVLIGVIGTILLLTFLAFTWRRFPALAVGWLIFFVMILPTMGIIGFTNVLASDKYAYLPVIGLLASLTWLLNQIWNRQSGFRVQGSGSRIHQPEFEAGQQEDNTAIGPKARRPCMSAFNFQLLTFSLTFILGGAAIRMTSAQYKHWRDTETFYTRMIDMAGGVPELYDNLGVSLAREDRPDRAVPYFEKAIAKRPDFAECHHNLASALAETGKLEESIWHDTEAVRIWPSYANAHFTLAESLFKRAEQAKGVDPNMAKQFSDVAKQFSKSADHYATFLRLNPPIALNAPFKLAQALSEANRLEEAVRIYDNLIQANPADIGARTNRANLLARLNRDDAAFNEYATVVRMNPNFAVGRINMARAFKRRKGMDKAIAEFEIATKLEPREGAIHLWLGEALEEAGRLDEAIAAYERSTLLSPGNAKAHFALGAAYERKANTQAALHEFMTVVRLNPNDATAKARLAALLPLMQPPTSAPAPESAPAD